MSRVVRIVNLDDGQSEEQIRLLIQTQVPLQRPIGQIYVRKCDDLNRTYAFVIFESTLDATSTAYFLDNRMFENKRLCVELIGPDEQYTKFQPEVNKEENNDVPKVQINQRKNKNYVHWRPVLISTQNRVSSQRPF